MRRTVLCGMVALLAAAGSIPGIARGTVDAPPAPVTAWWRCG
jgi:hypothetical protein